MKLTLVALLLFIGLGSIVAQTNPFTVQTKADLKLDEGKLEQLPNGKFLLSKYHYKRWQYFKGMDFSLYDKDLNFIKTNSFTPYKEISDECQIRWVYLKDKTYVLFADLNKSNTSAKVYASTFNEGELKLSDVPTMLYETSKRISLAYIPTPINTNGDKFAVINEYRTKDYEYLDEYTLSINVYDKDLKKLYGGDYPVGVKKEKMWGPNSMYWDIEFENAKLTNEGNLFTFIQVKNEDKYITSHLELLFIPKNTGVLKKQILNIPDYHVNSASFHEDDKGNMYIVGSYGDVTLKNRVVGSYYVKVDANTGEIDSKIQLIPIPSNFPGERSEKLYFRSGTTYFITHGVHFLSNGTMNIVAELYKKSYSTYFVPTGNEHMDTYGLEVYIINVTPINGKVNWYKEVKKLQKAFNIEGETLSIVCSQKGNNTNLFFIDNSDNFSLKAGELPKQFENRKGGNLAGVSINEQGEIAKFNLGEVDDIAPNFRIRNFKKGINGNVYCDTEKKGKAQLVNILVK